MEKEYLIDTLLNLRNESDALEADLENIQTSRDCITILMKDGSVFRVTVSA